MPRRPPSPRTSRRASEREAAKLRRDLEHRARLEPGGAPTHPIEVISPTQVDVRAEATPCPLCTGRLTLDEHTAEVVDGRRLRIARCHCLECGTPREIYFHLAPTPES